MRTTISREGEMAKSIGQPGVIAEPYIGLCKHIARKMTAHLRYLREDAEGAALLGLAEALAGFDPSRGSLEARVSTKARSRVLDMIRAEIPKGLGRGARSFDRSALPRPIRAAGDVASTTDGAWGCEYEEIVVALSGGLPAWPARAFRARMMHADAASPPLLGRRVGCGARAAMRFYAEAIVILRGQCS